MHVSIYIFLFCSVLRFASGSIFICNEYFGEPLLNHCRGAILRMPDGLSRKMTLKQALLRKFVEPQYLRPPFREVNNTWKTEMEQVPRIWRFGMPGFQSFSFNLSTFSLTHSLIEGTCRLLLASYAKGDKSIPFPEVVTSWGFLLERFHSIYEHCLEPGGVGGFTALLGKVFRYTRREQF